MLSLGRQDSSTTVCCESTPPGSTRRDLWRSTSIRSPFPRNWQLRDTRFIVEVRFNEEERGNRSRDYRSPRRETQKSLIIMNEGLTSATYVQRCSMLQSARVALIVRDTIKSTSTPLSLLAPANRAIRKTPTDGEC